MKPPSLILYCLLVVPMLLHGATLGHRVPVGSGTVGAVVVAAAPLDPLAFKYPKSMEQWSWSLQSTTNFVDWTTEITWPAGLVATGTMNIVRDGQMKFYRMKGTP